LKPACVNGDSSYENRKAARAKEVVALREAQGIFEDAFAETSGTSGKKFLQISSH